jgi:regulatory protein
LIGNRKIITQELLRQKGLRYLERYAASTQSVRHVLNRHFLKSTRSEDFDPIVLNQWLAAIIERFTSTGLLNDYLFAQNRAKSLFRDGASMRMIRSKLLHKGISNPIIERVICEIVDEWKDPDLKAAIRLSERKRLGPFRKTETREVFRKRDLGVLGRAGFSFEIARKIVDASDLKDLDQSDG